MFCRYLLKPLSVSLCLGLVFVSMTCPLESVVLKSLIIILWGLMCVLSFSKVSSMNVVSVAFGT